jgi:hypothetical protein
MVKGEMARNLVTPAEWARTFGISRPAANGAIKRLQIPLHDGRVDADEATLLYRQSTRLRVRSPIDAAAKNSAGGEHADLYQRSRAQQAAVDLERSEVALGVLRKRLIDREFVERTFFDVFRGIRDAAFSSCRRMAMAAHGAPDLRSIEVALEDEMRAVFNGWREALQAKLDAGQAAAQEGHR